MIRRNKNLLHGVVPLDSATDPTNSNLDRGIVSMFMPILTFSPVRMEKKINWNLVPKLKHACVDLIAKGVSDVKLSKRQLKWTFAVPKEKPGAYGKRDVADIFKMKVLQQER